jgi:hypothetical protein
LFSFTPCASRAVIDREAQFVAKGSPADRARQAVRRKRREVEWIAKRESGERIKGKKREVVGCVDAVEMLAVAWES